MSGEISELLYWYIKSIERTKKFRDKTTFIKKNHEYTRGRKLDDSQK